MLLLKINIYLKIYTIIMLNLYFFYFLYQYIFFYCDECLRNDEKDEGNEAGFSLHDTPADCLF